MKNLKVTFEGSIEECELVEGKKSPYVKLSIKQGFTRIYSFSRDLTLIDIMPSLLVTFNGKINEFDKKYSLEIIGVQKK